MKALYGSAAALAILLSATPAVGQGISNVSISGNQASASISLAGGVAADLTLTFDSVTGLSASSLGMSAQLVSPSSLALLARLPTGVGAPAAFPVLLRIEPTALGGLDFHGAMRIELHTANLEFVAGTPLRLFAAPVGGAFVDITSANAGGSYRPRGTRGSFSDFLIVSDLRPAADVIEAKFDRLESLLSQFSAAIPSEWGEELSGMLESGRAAYELDDLGEAQGAIDAFVELVEDGAGDPLPDRWRAARDLSNVAGELIAAGETLLFSLRVAGGGGG